MNNKLDPETLKIPAFMRKKAIVSQSRQKLILTALDRKDAGLSPNSKKPLAPSRIAPRKSARFTFSTTPKRVSPPRLAGGLRRAALSQPAPQTLFSETPQISLPKKFQLIGEVTHFLPNIDVAIIMLSAPLKIGEMVLIEGDEIVFAQEVSEMQIDRKPVNKAKKGSHIGLKSAFPARVNGKVYRFSL